MWRQIYSLFVTGKIFLYKKEREKKRLKAARDIGFGNMALLFAFQKRIFYSVKTALPLLFMVIIAVTINTGNTSSVTDHHQLFPSMC